MLVFPNPTKDEINIQLPTFEKGGLMQVYGVDGKLYMEEQIGNKKQLNLSKFAKGIYLIQVKTINQVYSAKVTLN